MFVLAPFLICTLPTFLLEGETRRTNPKRKAANNHVYQVEEPLFLVHNIQMSMTKRARGIKEACRACSGLHSTQEKGSKAPVDRLSSLDRGCKGRLLETLRCQDDPCLVGV
ncbi:hypothetical protein B0T19DRAFT_159752 [Cercophora scortea]|uniref:Secreted protein n=1 Tax=Cercophora scortea TaxID=314031 RepID=A0AAE0ILI4_9PEZI|nr:hypothetical protein B0T19DRAFT_159752 [Cercophora scortea]